ncbi:hypothetical protein ACIODS_05665 [Micromonospora chalcea]
MTARVAQYTLDPAVWLQGSGTPKRGKNRLHLDLVADEGRRWRSSD